MCVCDACYDLENYVYSSLQVNKFLLPYIVSVLNYTDILLLRYFCLYYMT